MMGNQLFQLAALIGHAARESPQSVTPPPHSVKRPRRHGRNSLASLPPLQVVVPDIRWTGREQERQRVFELLELDVASVPLDFLKARVQDIYQERHYHYDPKIAEVGCGVGGEAEEGGASCNLDLLGRFQSFWYFAHAEEEVRRRMRIRESVLRRARAVVEHVRASFRDSCALSASSVSGGGCREGSCRRDVRVVSLHVRRGDNVPHERAGIYQDWRNEAPHLYGQPGDTQAPHLLLSTDYIDRAAARIEHADWCGNAGCVYLVFADTARDIQWCKDNIPPRLRYRFFSEFVPLVSTWVKGAMVQGTGKRVAALTDVLDLAGIAACDAHIISTSSFSWWGAYLNDRKDKKVIVPTPWFNPDHPMGREANTDTMHPPDWELLSLLNTKVSHGH